MMYHTTGHFYPSADIIMIHFESATYVTSETSGAFDGMRLVSSKPFPKDTQVIISFQDISATGMPSINTHEYDMIVSNGSCVGLLITVNLK